MKQIWYEWDNNLRPFFKVHAKPAYKDTYPKDEKEAARQRNKMDRIQPICLYIDYIIQEHNFTVADVLTRLQEARKELCKITKSTITETAFVIDKMRNFIQRSQNVPPTGMVDALTHAGLPLPTMTAKMYRNAMWDRGGKKKKE